MEKLGYTYTHLCILLLITHFTLFSSIEIIRMLVSVLWMHQATVLNRAFSKIYWSMPPPTDALNGVSPSRMLRNRIEKGAEIIYARTTR